MIFRMVEQQQLPVRNACSASELVSKSAYYRWKNKEQDQEEDLDLQGKIEEIALEFPAYGYRRITKELARRKEHANHKKVLRIMRQNGLLCKKKAAFKPVTTQSNHGLRVYPNLAAGLDLTQLNQLWVADITYIRLGKDFAYLAGLLDVFSRKCVGWDLARTMDAQLTLNALNCAVERRKELGFGNLVHHSDQGVQYASHRYVARLAELGIKISMSRKGNAYDNAFAESFWKTLKVEEVYMNEYETFEEAYQNIQRFIEEVYNKKRLHSSIGYIPPDEFEQEVLNTPCKI